MKMEKIEKRFTILSLREMRQSLRYLRETQQKHRVCLDDDKNIFKLENFLDYLIDKEEKELKEMEGENKDDKKRN